MRKRFAIVECPFLVNDIGVSKINAEISVRETLLGRQNFNAFFVGELSSVAQDCYDETMQPYQIKYCLRHYAITNGNGMVYSL